MLKALCAVLVLIAGCAPRPPARLTDGSLRYTIATDGAIEDNATNLVWTQDANLGGYGSPWAGVTWDEANQVVSEMNAGQRPNMGYTDWRLPTIPELQRFLEGIIPDRWTVNEPFNNLSDTAYWTSTQGRRRHCDTKGPCYDLGSPDYAWVVDSGGTILPQNKSATRRLWPVRGVTAGSPPP